MNILFLTHPGPNYVPDLLLHGLRKLLGEKVVDYPKKECLYSGLQEGKHPEIYCDPFWFPDDNDKIDRGDVETKLRNRYFDYIISDVRSLSILNIILKKFSGMRFRVIIIDGEDLPVPINFGLFVICRRETDGTDYSIPLPMALPEEIFNRIASYDDNPKSYSIGFLGSAGKESDNRRELIEKIESYYPDTLLQATPISESEGKHPDERLGLDSYYDNLQRCSVVLTLRGAGYDTFRFWENAACNALHLSEEMTLFVPNDFKDKQHIMRFSNIDELRMIMDNCLANKDETDKVIQNSRQHLIDYHLTTKRATYFLDRVKRAFCL
ncbi:MAG: glycosyltransferase family 1 protein [Candidatus Scalindua sp. AMX11]|nr:MAG: glycosyltransferase family 1 protein [Candidatus Scalindua sp.]NOG85860.1 glycosyltransferase family 1 protein [Planctomycetota bacterium]RZV96968.1 MAG: glycosyltransferase family 1 protein [Candidatus Scalindua sp. SCAELEC01]TDE66420.1 MAG: glycosyltransferase family 1 protein [Candidatus Scalindua sp. AMX11]